MRKSSGELFIVVIVIIGVMLLSVVSNRFTSNGVSLVKDEFSGFLNN